MKQRPGLIAVVLIASRLGAQQPSAETDPLGAMCVRELTAGSAAERTVLIAGSLTTATFSTVLRPLSPVESPAIYDSVRHRFGVQEERNCGGIWNSLWARTWYNAGSAHPDRDGAVWQGRGLTASLTGGVTLRRGPLSASVQPIAIFSENRAFDPYLPSATGDFREPVWGRFIDLPYRFGSKPYATVDPGESYVRMEFHRVALGLTTQSQQWGPAHFYPLVLATEGAGYPRGFAEARRVPVWIGNATAHWQLGVLEASPYSELAPGERSRVISAFMASFSPRGLRGLELGASRFFHLRRTPHSLNWSNATLPFTGILKSQSRDTDIGGFNQLASLFFRVAPALAGVEAYGEFYREDHNANLRDVIGEPDHESAYTLGVRRVWKSDSGVSAFTLEHANGRMSHLVRVRGETPMYLHSPLTEGHTFRGQALGSSAVLGGGGTVLSWNRIGARRSQDITFEVRANAQVSEGGTWYGSQVGAYALRLGEKRIVRGKLYGATLDLQRSYGSGHATNVTLGLTRAN